jgi:hypothetical protein
MPAPHDDDPSENSALSGLRGVGRSAGAGRAESVDAAAAPGSAAAVEQASATGEVAAADPLQALTEALAAGAIDADAARNELIATIVRAQAPAGADPAVWQAIEADVRALLADDPILADLLRP